MTELEAGIDAVIKRHVPDARLLSCAGGEIAFRLPKTDAAKCEHFAITPSGLCVPKTGMNSQSCPWATVNSYLRVKFQCRANMLGSHNVVSQGVCA
jgi:hypothetical protein